MNTVNTHVIDTVWNSCNFQDWDGHGAEPIPVAVMDVARRLIEGFPLCTSTCCDIIPQAEGTIVLEWTKDSKSFYIEFCDKQFTSYSRIGDVVTPYMHENESHSLIKLGHLMANELQTFYYTQLIGPKC